MFLTGFDATTLNTLWVDKNLKQHGLIQAFSRTNRILNSVKNYGNIVCFRNLRKSTDNAIALFGDENAQSTILLRPYEDYLHGYTDDEGKHVDGYLDLLEILDSQFPLEEPVIGEERQKEFVKLFGSILRLRNILSSFDQFEEEDPLPERDLQDHQSNYLDIYQDIRNKQKERVDIIDDVVFEMELVKQVEINIDYILNLVKSYHENNCKDKEVLVDVQKAIGSSMQLRSKKELIMKFIGKVDSCNDIDRDWPEFVEMQRKDDLQEIITNNRLKPEETKRFVKNAFRDGEIRTTGTDIDGILPPMSRFGNGGKNRTIQKASVTEQLKEYFDRYFGLV
jgi:type I restriction enzyme R subunit